MIKEYKIKHSYLICQNMEAKKKLTSVYQRMNREPLRLPHSDTIVRNHFRKESSILLLTVISSAS